MPEGTLDRRVRVGYGLGSVATGTFGTVPGADAAALPHRHARHHGRARGRDRLRAEGVGRRAQPDRGSDQRPIHRPARSATAVPAASRARARGVLRADVRLGRPRLDHSGRPVGAGDVRAVRDGLRLLPGAVRRDARRDHRVVRRAHPADDVAGRDPRVLDHAERRDRTGDPRRRGRPRRLRGDGRRRSRCCWWPAWSAPTSAPGTRRSARPRPTRRVCATSCGSWPARETSGCC